MTSTSINVVNEKLVTTKQKVCDIMVKCISEMLGVAILLFLGCLGCIHDAFPIPTYVFASFNFAITITMIIQMGAPISGAHFNPSITIAAWILGQIDFALIPFYVISQFIGGLIGYGLLDLLIPEIYTNGLCVTAPSNSTTEVQALFLEIIGTTLLVMVVCTVWDPKNHGYFDSLSLKIGLMLMPIFLGIAPFSGGGFNIPRSFAPAVFKNQWTSHWIYWVGPTIGGFIAPLFYKYTFIEGLYSMAKKTN